MPTQQQGESRKTSRYRLLRWMCVLFWMAVIYAFSDQPYSGRETEKYLGGMNVPVRKLGHIGEYMILFLLLRWALDKPEEDGDSTAEERDANGGASRLSFKTLASPSVVAFTIAIGYAATDEWHQSYVPGRSSSWSDVAVDACGVSLGAIALVGLKRLKSR